MKAFNPVESVELPNDLSPAQKKATADALRMIKQKTRIGADQNPVYEALQRVG